MAISFLVLAFAKPYKPVNKENNSIKNVFIYIDNSLSMSYHSNLSSTSLLSGIDDIIDRLEKKKIPLDIYNFGSKIDTNWNNSEDLFNESSTNIGQVLNHVEQDINKDLAGSIIITDGQANQGFDVLAPTLNTIKPIHIIGVGDKNPLLMAQMMLGEEEIMSERNSHVPILIKGTEGVSIEFAKCCMPVPGDTIIGHLSKVRGFVIHRRKCRHINSFRKDRSRWIGAEWSKTIKQTPVSYTHLRAHET